MKYLILVFPLIFCTILFAQDNNNNLDSLKSIPLPSEDKQVWVQAPEYPGGNSAMSSFINNEFNCPEEASKIGFKERITVFVMLDSIGKVVEVNLIKDYGYGINEEISRVFKAMPNWKPASSGGKYVGIKWRYQIFIDCTPDSYFNNRKKKSKKR